MAEKRLEKKDPVQTVAAPIAPTQPRRATGWRTWLYRLLAMTVVPAFFLILLEGLLRLNGYGYPAGLFLPKEDGGQKEFVDNPHFGQRFFPPGLARGLAPTVLPGTKAAGTYRIFILGESAAMGYPDPSYHFGRLLQTMLQERYPGTRFEIINTAMVAINSHVILPIARDCAELEPDLFVVYMGNNEVVGPYGAAGVLGPYTPNLALIRASIQVKATRTGQLLANLIRTATDSGKTPRVWSGMSMFVGKEVPADDPRLTAVYDHFSRNLQDICTVGQNAGAKVVVCTVASNLKDSAPFASVHAASLSDAHIAQWQKHYEEGVSREAAQEPAAAVASYRQALAIDDKRADLHFRLARCLLALKQRDDARRHFILARDLDALRFRTDSRLNETIRKTVSDMQDEGICLADVEQAFEKASPDRIPGEELLYEHVHLTFEGNYWLARSVLEQMDHILPDSVRPRGGPSAPVLSIQECQERLPFTDWNRQKSLRDIVGMASNPPFINQLDHEERLKRWRGQLDQLQKRLDAKGMQEAVAAYQRVLERSPGDFHLHKDFAALLGEQGQLNKAIRQVHEGLKLVPHDAHLYGRLAELLGKEGNLDEALAACDKSLKLKPDDPQFYNLKGKLLMAASKLDQAVAAFEQALKLVPDAALIHVNLADALRMQQQFSRAADEYREAIRLDPQFAQAHHQLSRLFASQGHLDDAQRHMQESLRIDPNQAPVLADLATLLEAQGHVAEAVTHMEKAVKLQPNSPNMKLYLEKLKQRQKKAS